MTTNPSLQLFQGLLNDLRARVQRARELPNRVAAGDVNQNSAILWARARTPGSMFFEVSTDPFFNNVQAIISQNVSEPRQPAKVEVKGLNPGTRYFYRATDAAGSSSQGTFKTAAAPGVASGLRFGVTGDWRGELSPYPGIANAVNRNLDFFVAHGDTIYADYASPVVPKRQAETLDDYRKKHREVYKERFGLNSLGQLRSTTSTFATIDDHEVINDFSGGAPISSDPRFGPGSGLINDSALYETGMKVFQEYNPIRDEFYGSSSDSRTSGERKLYRYRTFGKDASLIVLDNRSFRDAPVPEVTNFNDLAQVQAFLAGSFNPNRTMLGKTQLADLKRDLLDAKNQGITWKFVMVPEPIQNLGLAFASDRFDGYAAERSEILNFINQNQIDNVVFVAADIHGTVVNNLTYQTSPTGPQIPTTAFEISTGSLAFDAPFGPTVVDLAAQLNLLPKDQAALYNSLPIPAKEQFMEGLLNSQLRPFGFDPVGLQGSPIRANLLQGGYLATSTYGWTEFEIDRSTQQLKVTTYGIPPYTEAEMNADPNIVKRTPGVVSQFTVDPRPVAATTTPTAPPVPSANFPSVSLGSISVAEPINLAPFPSPVPISTGLPR